MLLFIRDKDDMDGGDETEMQWRQKIQVSQRPWQFGRSNDEDDDAAAALP